MERVVLPPFPKARTLPRLHARDLALPPADATHLPLFADIHAASRAAELLLFPWPQAQKRAFLDQQFVLQHKHYVSAYPKGDFRAVTRAGEPVGRFYFDRSGQDWLVIDILLGTAAQGGGIGTALVAWLQRSCADAGAEGVRLSVTHNNKRAHALYRRLGFTNTEDTSSATHQGMIWRP